MKRNKILVPLLVAAALVISWVGLAVAQGGPPPVKVMIDGNRNALISAEKEETGGKETGNLNLGTDLASGLTTFNTQVDLKDAMGAQGGNVSLYSELGDNNLLLLGDVKVPIPPEAKVTLNTDGKAQMNGSVGHAEFKADFSTSDPSATTGMNFTKISLDGSSKSDYKTASGKINFAADVPNVGTMTQGVRSITANIAETGTGADLATSVDVTAVVDANSQAGQGIKGMAPQAKMISEQIKGQLTQMGVTVDVAEITKMEVTGDTATFAMTLKVKNLRELITKYSAMMTARLPMDATQASDSVKEIIALQLDKLNIEAKIETNSVSGSIDTNLSGLDKFIAGYTKLMAAIQEQSMKAELAKEHAKSEELALKWVAAIQKKAMEFNAQYYQLLLANNVTVDQSFKALVEVKDGALHVTGDFKSDTTNMDKVMAGLKQAGYAVGTKAGLLFNVKAENNQVTGNLYASSDGNIVEALKQFLVQPAAQDPDLKPIADTLNSIQVKDMKATGELKDQKLSLNGYVETSDLSPVAKAGLGQIDPNFQATPEGARLAFSSADGKGKMSLKIRLKEFMPGKSEDDIKKAVGTLMDTDNVEVVMNAKDGDLALDALSKPSVSMPGDLVALKTQSEAQLFVSGGPGGLPGLGGAGGSTGTIIAIVVGALVLIGIVVAASKKKS